MRNEKAAFLLLLLFSSLTFAQDACVVPPTVRTYVNANLDEATHTISLFVYNESMDAQGRLVRVGIPNGFVVVMSKDAVAGEGAAGYSSCKMLTGNGAQAGKITLEYEPLDGDVPRRTYYFTFCPVVTNSTLLSECATIPDENNYPNPMQWRDNVGYRIDMPWRDTRVPPCAGAIGSIVNYPQMLPSRAEVYLENESSPDAAQLCWPLMLILGLLAGAMFAAGKNPFAGFDFSAPRMSRGKQYQMRAQSKSFDVGSALYGATNIASVSFKKTAEFTVDGNKLKDSKSGDVVATRNGQGQWIGNDNKVLQNVKIATVAVDANKKVVGMADSNGNIIGAQGSIIGKKEGDKFVAVGRDGNVLRFDRDGKPTSSPDGAVHEFGTEGRAFQTTKNLWNLHSERRIENFVERLGGRAGEFVTGNVALVGGALSRGGGLVLEKSGAKSAAKTVAFGTVDAGKATLGLFGIGKKPAAAEAQVKVDSKQPAAAGSSAPTGSSNWATFWSNTVNFMNPKAAELLPILAQQGRGGGMLGWPVGIPALSPDLQSQADKDVQKIPQYASVSEWWNKGGKEGAYGAMWRLLMLSIVIAVSGEMGGKLGKKGSSLPTAAKTAGSLAGLYYFSDMMWMPVFQDFLRGAKMGGGSALSQLELQRAREDFVRLNKKFDEEIRGKEQEMSEAKGRDEKAQLDAQRIGIVETRVDSIATQKGWAEFTSGFTSKEWKALARISARMQKSAVAVEKYSTTMMQRASVKSHKGFVAAAKTQSTADISKWLSSLSEVRMFEVQQNAARGQMIAAREMLWAGRMHESKKAAGAQKLQASADAGAYFATFEKHHDALEELGLVVRLRTTKDMENAVGKNMDALFKSTHGASATPQQLAEFAQDMKHLRDAYFDNIVERADAMSANASSEIAFYRLGLAAGVAGTQAFYAGLGGTNALIAGLAPAAGAGAVAVIESSANFSLVASTRDFAQNIEAWLETSKHKLIAAEDLKLAVSVGRAAKNGTLGTMRGYGRMQHVEKDGGHLLRDEKGQVHACELKGEDESYWYISSNVRTAFGDVGVQGRVAKKGDGSLERGENDGDGKFVPRTMDGSAQRAKIREWAQNSMHSFNALLEEKGKAYAGEKETEENKRLSKWRESQKETVTSLDELLAFERTGGDYSASAVGDKGMGSEIKRVTLGFSRSFEPTENRQQVKEKLESSQDGEEDLRTQLRAAINSIAPSSIRDDEDSIEWVKKNRGRIAGDIILELVGGASPEIFAQEEKNRELAQKRVELLKGAIKEIFGSLDGFDVREKVHVQTYTEGEVGEFDAFAKRWAGGSGGRSELMRAINDGTVEARDSSGNAVSTLEGRDLETLAFVLKNRKQFEEEYSSGTIDAQGKKIGPRLEEFPALEAAFALERRATVNIQMSLRVEESVQLPMGELLGDKFTTHAAATMALGTNVLAGMRRYDEKVNAGAHAKGASEIAAGSFAQAQEIGNAIQMCKDAQGAGTDGRGDWLKSHGFEALADLDAHAKLVATSPAAQELFDSSNRGVGLFNSAYYEQPYMQRRQLLSPSQPQDMKEGWKKFKAEILTIPSAHGQLLGLKAPEMDLDAGVYERKTTPEEIGNAANENMRVGYAASVESAYFAAKFGKEVPAGLKGLKDIGREEMPLVLDYSRAVGTSSERDGRISEVLSRKTPEERRDAVYEFGVKGLGGEQKFVEDYKKLNDEEKVAMARMCIRRMGDAKEDRDEGIVAVFNEPKETRMSVITMYAMSREERSAFQNIIEQFGSTGSTGLPDVDREIERHKNEGRQN